MKFIFSRLVLLVLLWQTGCTYQIVQQQNGHRRGSQMAVVGGGNRPAITAYQSTGPISRPAYDPPSTYPEYNGYPGSGSRSGYSDYNGYYGGATAPAYPPDDAGIPYPLPIRPSYSPTIHAEFNLY